MKIKRQIIYDLTEAFKKIDNCKFSPIITYTLSKNYRRLQEEMSDLEKVRVKLVEQHGLDKRDEKGNINQTAFHNFQKEWQEFLSGETELVLSMLKLNDLKLDSNNIPITALAALDNILIQPEEK